MTKAYEEDTIVAISTPIGEGGISIVRMSGPATLEIADKIFVSKDGGKPSRYETYTVHYGHIIDHRQKTIDQRLTTHIIDEVILTVMKASASYTKEDIVEINCHGSLQAIKEVLDLVVSLGARVAEPGEFTKRAFLNGRIDLVQAEAVLDVIRSRTEGSLKVAVSQLEGELSKKVNGILDKIIDITSNVEASIDFPDEEVEILKEEAILKKTKDIIAELKHLTETFDDGVVLREGVLAMICGKPNVGKSSLMNILLKRDRVIVSPIPGTTRDAIEEMINIKGIPIRLVDTAGIMKTDDSLKKEGIKKSKHYLELADIVLLMLDWSSMIDSKDRDIIKLTAGKKRFVVINKTDLPKKIDEDYIKKNFEKEKVINISVEKKRNIEVLVNAMVEMVFSGSFSQGEGIIVTNARHKDLLDKALKNMLSVNKGLESGDSSELIAVDLNEAIYNLGLIIGRSVSDDILNRIFENFCIGK